MARLIVVEDGKRRQFRLKDGRLTIGSGSASTLQLSSSGLAEVHAELEFVGGVATLRLRAGVEPARVEGRRVSGEVVLADGVAVELGGAELSIAYDDEEKGGLVARRNSGRETKGVKAALTGAGAAVRRPRRQVKKGAPAALYLILAPAVLLAIYIGFRSFAASAGERGFDFQTSLNRVTASVDEADWKGALRELDKIDAQDTITPEWRARFAEVRARAEEGIARAQRSKVLIDATKNYLDPQIHRFEREYIDGASPDPARVRVLLLRIEHALANWPDHPEIGAVKRLQERYSRIVDLSDPPSFEDIAFEVESLTWAKPRNYDRAFEVLNGFLETASADDRAAGIDLLDELETARRDYYEDRIGESKYQWEKGNRGEAAMWLQTIVTMIGDQTMADDAATRLTKMEGIEGLLEAWRRDKPETFAKLMENAILRKKAQAAGLF